MVTPSRLRGDPAARARGVAARALLAALVKPGKPVPLMQVTGVLRVKRSTICGHLGRMRDEQKISGYSTAGGKVWVW